MPPPFPLVSFVVPVRNDATRLQRCLASIRAAAYPADRIELIVVDNGSTDGSPDVAAAAGAQVLVRPTMRVAEMRNEALRSASGDIIAFIDSDHEIGGRWVQSAVETLMAPGTGAVGSPYRAPVDGTWVQRQYDRLRRRRAGVHEADWLASGNLAVWRREFERVGGFDTSLHTCEDVDFCQRLRANGVRLMSDARMESTHFGDPATLGEVFLGELWRGRDNLRVSLRSPLAFRNVASLALSLVELLLLFLVIIGAATVASRGPALIVAAVAGLLTLTALQAYRMLRSASAVRTIDLAQTFAVASVYGVARALALVARAPHQVRRPGSR